MLSCFNAPSLIALVNCFDKFTIPFGHFNQSSYRAAQPTDSQLAAWKHTVSQLLAHGASASLPDALQNIYALDEYTDPQSGSSYCVLHEHTMADYYIHGWGLFIVPSVHVERHIHISAPHPGYDLRTPEQAATIFRNTRAHSLLISGRSRGAFPKETTCIPGRGYWVTDPTHDTNEPFHQANLAIWEYQIQANIAPQDYAFIQLHGKAVSTCPDSQMFISTGLDSPSWYTSLQNQNTPVMRLTRALRQEFDTTDHSDPSYPSDDIPTISLPSDNPECKLTATTNVFGRIVNSDGAKECDSHDQRNSGLNRGIPAGFEFPFGISLISFLGESHIGSFIHVEQAIDVRRGKDNAHEKWVRAVEHAFPSQISSR